MIFRVFTRSSAFVTIALLNDFIHTWAQVPEAAVPGENEEYCSHGSNIEPHNVQELTSTSSTSFQANHQHEGGNVLPDDSAPRSSEQLPLSEQPPENWMQMKEDAVFSNCCSDNLYKCEKQHLQESWLGSSGFVLNDLAKTNLRTDASLGHRTRPSMSAFDTALDIGREEEEWKSRVNG